MRSDPIITVTCENCNSSEEVGLTPLVMGGYDERNINNILRRMGWVIDNGKDICPDCSEADIDTDD